MSSLFENPLTTNCSGSKRCKSAFAARNWTNSLCALFMSMNSLATTSSARAATISNARRCACPRAIGTAPPSRTSGRNCRQLSTT